MKSNRQGGLLQIRSVWSMFLAGMIFVFGRNAMAASSFTEQGTASFGSGILVSTFPAGAGNSEFSLRLSTGLFLGSGVLAFPDGTTQASALVSSSTSTILQGLQNFSNHTLGPCVAGSTVTMTVTASSFIDVFFTGRVDVSTTNGNVYDAIVGLGVLMDGNALPGMSGSGIEKFMANAATDVFTTLNASFNVASPARVSSGSHSFCLQLAVIGNDGLGHLLGNVSTAEFGTFQIR